MSLLNTIGSITGIVAASSSAMSLIGSTKALLMGTLPGVRGIEGFMFDIPLGEELTLSAQITDHYIESNTPIQDHIAIEPLRIRLSGAVSELVYSRDKYESYINQLLDRLGPLGVLSPATSARTRAYLSQYNQTKQAVTKAWEGVNKLKTQLEDPNAQAQNKQQLAYAKFAGWMSSRSQVYTDPATMRDARFLIVETPWGTFNNMAIESVSFMQDETSKDLSTIELTLKQMSIMNVETTKGRNIGRAKAKVKLQEQGTANTEVQDSAALNGLSPRRQ